MTPELNPEPTPELTPDPAPAPGPPMTPDGRRLTQFFSGGRDDRGRTLDEILAWDDVRLESVHDYIQWLFPLPEPSAANLEAPVLDSAAIAAIRTSPLMQGRLRGAYDRMVAFYGFEFRGAEVLPGPGFPPAARRWLRAGNHNHLRLTRMLRSLRVLGLEAEAEALWKALDRLYRAAARDASAISPETHAFWRWAMQKQQAETEPDAAGPPGDPGRP